MRELFQNALTASFYGSVVIAAVLILRPLLKKTPKKFLCLLWMLAFLRLMLPFEIQSGLSLQPETVPVHQTYEARQEQPYVPERMQENRTALPENSSSQEVLSGDITPVTENREISAPAYAEAPETREKADPGTVLAWIWLGGVCGFVVYVFVSYLRLKLLVREAVRVRNGIWECERIETAFILGFIKPQIYLPMGMSRETRRHILAHERTHLEKGDHWYKMIGYIALAVHWFNPFVWVAYVMLCKDIEMACDERVVQFMELAERKAYSMALLNCSTNHPHFAACPVAFGEVSVKYRIKSVLKYRKPSFWISLLGVIAIAFVAVCLVTSPTKEPENMRTGETEPTEASEETSPSGQWTEPAGPVSEVSTLAWAQTLTPGDVDYIDLQFTQLEDKAYKHITDSQELAEMIAFINSAEGTFERDPHVAGFSGEWINIVLKDGRMRCMGRYGDTHFSVGGSLFRVEKEWLDNWPKEGDSPLPEGYDDFTNDTERLPAPESEMSYPIVHLDGNLPEETQPPALTEDEQLLKEWGVKYLVEDDVLTRFGSEVWFAQSDGANMVVSTNDEYWLEKKTETGWEKLPLLAEPEWKESNYVLSHGMYTMLAVDWSGLYGELGSGTYRMGKIFTRQEGNRRCTAYAEFEIFHNDTATADETAAVEKCFSALEELKAREHIHYKVTTSTKDMEEVWWNGGNYVAERSWRWAVEMAEEPGGEPGYEYRTGITVRKDGIGYLGVYERRGDMSSPIDGIEVANLQANRNGWELYRFSESLYLSSFERGNEVIDFSAGDCIISDELVSFHKYWSDPAEYSKLTFRFDNNGKITKMEYETHYDDMSYQTAFEIFETSEAEIDAKIKSCMENVHTDSFSWEDAKAEYTDEKYNIREDGFANTGSVTLSGPADAAVRALREYPGIKDLLGTRVAFDEAANMWRVTLEKYADYQSTYEYRDIYMDESGVTKLLVYEGPVEERP